MEERLQTKKIGEFELRMANSMKAKVNSAITLDLEAHGLHFMEEFVVADLAYDLVLGLPWVMKNEVKISVDRNDEAVILMRDDGWEVKKYPRMPIDFCTKEELSTMIKCGEQAFAIFLNRLELSSASDYSVPSNSTIPQSCACCTHSTTEDSPSSAAPHSRKGVDGARNTQTESTDFNALTLDEIQQQPAIIQPLLRDFADVFNKELPPGPPPKRDVEFKVELVEGTQPIYKPPYRLSPKDEAESVHQIKAMMERELIRESSSDFGAPAILVMKKDGGKRLCIDYRALNQKTLRDSFPLPRTEDLLNKLKGATVFSKGDKVTYFWQIPVRPGDEKKLAFTTSFGSYEPKMMPFGVKNGPATAQRLSNKLYADLDFVLVYMDDVLIFSKNMEEHMKHLRIFFERLRQHKIYVKLSKCEFCVNKLDWLGHTISAQGIEMDAKKVEAIQAISPPKSVKQLQSFLGLINYYHRFIKNLAKISAPLTDLLKKSRNWEWTVQEQQAFQELKDQITTALVLQPLDMDLPFIVTTDASNTAIGGVLSQVGDDNKEHPIAFCSRKLTEVEQRRLSVPEKEMLAVHYSMQKWRHLLHSDFTHTVWTDNQAISHFQTQKQLSRKSITWQDELAEFQYRIEHKKGKDNPVTDALSRLNASEAVANQDDEFKERLIKAYNGNEDFGKAIKTLPDEHYSKSAGLLYFNDRLCIPKDYTIRTEILDATHHEAGHLGKAKTMELVTR